MEMPRNRWLSLEPLLEEIDITGGRDLVNWDKLYLESTNEYGDDISQCENCYGDGFVEYMEHSELWGEDCPPEPNHMVICPECGGTGMATWYYERLRDLQQINGVIVGCESGPNRRPFNEDWVRKIRSDCDKYAIKFFYKQGIRNGKIVKMPKLDGQVYNQRICCVKGLT